LAERVDDSARLPSVFHTHRGMLLAAGLDGTSKGCVGVVHQKENAPDRSADQMWDKTFATGSGGGNPEDGIGHGELRDLGREVQSDDGGLVDRLDVGALAAGAVAVQPVPHDCQA
jgi:hypothetical protein